jgi:hypothetical protein
MKKFTIKVPYSEKELIVNEALEFVHFAILEAMDGNLGELETALLIVELMREGEMSNEKERD